MYWGIIVMGIMGMGIGYYCMSRKTLGSDLRLFNKYKEKGRERKDIGREGL